MIFPAAGYNSALVITTATLLGVVCAVAGSFLFYRRRVMIVDAISHGSLPGIGAGFLFAYALGLDGGRNLPILLSAAALSGLLCAGCVQLLSRHTRLDENTCIGVALSGTYGLGVVLLSLIQSLPGGNRAGLDHFLLGQIAGLTLSDAALIAGIALLTLAVCLLFYKEFQCLCFDPDYAQSSGFSVRVLDFLLISATVLIVCAGLKAAGAILIVALLVIPPASAAFWVSRLPGQLILSAVFGGSGAIVGAALSSEYADIPTGSAIVLMQAIPFLFGLLFSPDRGLPRYIRKRSRL